MKKKKKGLFIVFEGIDGSGKDCHINRLYEKLTGLGYDVIKTAEPWISEAGKRMRKLALEGRKDISPREEARFYLEDRREHTGKIINPALSKGQIVLCGRYYYSTMAYQGALGADPEEIRRENESVVPIPDLVIMLRVDIEENMRRIFKRSKQIAKGYEKQDYLSKVGGILYNINAPYIKQIETSGDVEETAAKVYSTVKPYLENS